MCTCALFGEQRQTLYFKEAFLSYPFPFSKLVCSGQPEISPLTFRVLLYVSATTPSIHAKPWSCGLGNKEQAASQTNPIFFLIMSNSS